MSSTKLQYQTAIDFVEIELQTGRPTQARHIYNAMAQEQRINERMGAAVTIEQALDRQGNELFGNTTAKRFRIRIHDPKSFRQIKTLCEQMNGEYEISEESVVITALEIAFDTYKAGATARELAVIAADRYRWLTSPPIDSRWYFYREKGERRRYIIEAITGPTREADDNVIMLNDIIRYLADGWQLTDANSKSVDRRWHVYVKTRDTIGQQDENNELESKDRKLLSQDKWRARIEITLRGDALPFRTMAELEAFDIAKLTKHFKFRQIDNQLPRITTYAISQCSGRQLGRRGIYRKPLKIVGKYSRGKPLAYRHSSIADTRLNRVILRAFERFSRGWRK